MESRLDALALLALESAQWEFERQRPGVDTPHAILRACAGWNVAPGPDQIPPETPSDIVPAQAHPWWKSLMRRSADILSRENPESLSRYITPPSPPNPIGPWEDYFASMEGKPVHPLYQDLDEYLPVGGKAFDLAAGIGQGSLHLLEQGQSVWACDIHGRAMQRLWETAPSAFRSRLYVRVLSFDNLYLAEDYFDVATAGFCLFFMDRATLERKWRSLVGSLRPGGVFAGQFLGMHDDWASLGYTSHTRDEVCEMLSEFDLLAFEEVERDGKTTQGTPKHWHVFHVIARKSGHGSARERAGGPYLPLQES